MCGGNSSAHLPYRQLPGVGVEVGNGVLLGTGVGGVGVLLGIGVGDVGVLLGTGVGDVGVLLGIIVRVAVAV